MESKLVKTRRANLKAWVNLHGVPQAEKSFFSQCLGSGSFGEKAARRLEHKYDMGHLFLDTPIQEGATADRPVAPPAANPVPQVSAESVLTRVDAREQRLLTWFRESDERGKQTIESVAELVEKPTVPPAGS